MNLKEIEFNSLNHHLNQISIHFEDSATTVEVEAEEAPAISLLRSEEADTNLQIHCDTAIASYLKTLEEGTDSIDEVQAQVSSVLGRHVRYEGHAVTPIHTHDCSCCQVLPSSLADKVQKVNQAYQSLLVGRKITPSKPRQTPQPKKITATPLAAVGQSPLISIYNANNTKSLPGQFVTSTHQSNPTNDTAAQKALNGAKEVHQFFLKNFGLNSFNGKGSEMKSTVHYGQNFANAFWNGQQMVYGDGDGKHSNFTELSIVAHEFGHAVTGNKLLYQGESGAINEHLSDVWGSLVVQHKNKQTAQAASWLIGEGVLKAGKYSFPLRTMKAPGLAYNHPYLGKDPQRAHYSGRYLGTEDNGGVHINSGIPNKAFYLFATSQGGYAWEKAGRLWYLTLKTENLLKPHCTMHEFAHATIVTALKHYPLDQKMHKDLINAWKAVGLA
ncbi:MAG: M4 family metallopeptidase [Parachlamydia sp.]|nr:M4 family metallopeptidase [Parachlamydia sp.]